MITRQKIHRRKKQRSIVWAGLRQYTYATFITYDWVLGWIAYIERGKLHGATA
jgi:hypothetical protein